MIQVLLVMVVVLLVVEPVLLSYEVLPFLDCVPKHFHSLIKFAKSEFITPTIIKYKVVPET